MTLADSIDSLTRNTMNTQTNINSKSNKISSKNLNSNQVLLNSLIDNSSITPTVKAVFESSVSSLDSFREKNPDLLSRPEFSKPLEFVSVLDEFIASKEADIQDLCHFHYSEFISSVDELLTLKQNALHFKAKCIALNSNLQSQGDKLISKAEALGYSIKIKNRVSETVDSLTRCIYLCEALSRIDDCIKKKLFYVALGLLKQLENNLLNSSPFSEFEFVFAIKKKIPDVKLGIKSSVREDTDAFLAMIFENMENIGNLAFDSVSNVTVERNLNAKDNVPTSFNLIDSTTIDFTILYRGISIFKIFNETDWFLNYYSKSRTHQLNVILDELNRDIDEFLPVLQSSLFKLSGFFLIEHHIYSTSNEIISKSIGEDLWELAKKNLEKILTTQQNILSDSSEILMVKTLMIAFLVTLSEYSYSTFSIFVVLEGFRSKYIEMLSLDCSERIKNILKNEKYETFICPDENTWRNEIEKFQLYLPNESQPTEFPSSEKFSYTVIDLAHVALEFITELFLFSKDLPDVDDNYKLKPNELLINSINAPMNQMLSDVQDGKVKMSLMQVSIIAGNALRLACGCSYFEEYFASFTINTNKTHFVSSRQAFKVTQTRAEALMCSLLLEKVNSFMELADNLDFETEQEPTEPHYFASGIVTYLTSILEMLSFVPEESRTSILISACKHISNLLMNFVTDIEIKKISVNFVKSLLLDLEVFEEFTLASGGQSILDDCFSKTRQLFKILTVPSPIILLDSKTRSNEYNLLPDHELFPILEKVLNSITDKNLKKDYNNTLRGLKKSTI